MLIVAKNIYDIHVLKRKLSTEFETKDLSATKKILGMEILHDRIAEVLHLSQKKYIKKLLHVLTYSQRNL